MTTKYQPNDANQYAKIAHGTEVVEPDYDPQGNLLHDATRKYTWDADIHLMSVTTQGSPQSSPHSLSEEPGTAGASARGATGSVASRQASGLPHIAPHNAIDEAPSRTTTTRFVYDALHRRVGRVKDDGEVTVFVYEGWNVIAEKTVCRALTGGGENMKIETRYTWGEDLSGTLQGAGGIGGLLRATIVEASTNGTRKTAHEHTFSYDSNGNVILLTDGLGRETGRYAYDAFGKTLTATGPAAQLNRYRFSTKPMEEESGLVYYGYQYYDPVTGRWPSRDPIGELGGVNVYGMVGNRAIVIWDYLGLDGSSEETPCDQYHVGETREVCEAKITDGLSPAISAGADEVFKKIGNRFGVPGQISVATFNAFKAGLQQATTTAGATRAFYFRKKAEVCTKNGYWICSWYAWETSGTVPSWGYHDTMQLNLIVAQGVAGLEEFRQGWEAQVVNCQ